MREQRSFFLSAAVPLAEEGVAVLFAVCTPAASAAERKDVGAVKIRIRWNKNVKMVNDFGMDCLISRKMVGNQVILLLPEAAVLANFAADIFDNS